MFRGGRGGGRGGKKLQGPSLEWDDEGDHEKHISGRPEPKFPPTYIPPPLPPTPSDLRAHAHYLAFKRTFHDSPLYCDLDPSTLTDANGHRNPRATVDAFNAMPSYSKRNYEKTSRMVPDLTHWPMCLEFLPPELWSVCDPERKDKVWESEEGKKYLAGRGDSGHKGKKRKIAAVGDEVDGDEDDEDDEVVAGGRKKARNTASKKEGITKRVGERSGMEAEDDNLDDDVAAGGDEEGSDEAADTDFDEDDDEDDDYNAENYFDDEEGDDYGDDDGGGGGGDDGAYI